MITLKNVSFGYTSTPLLKDISFSIPKGSITTLLGPNGAGKTTLLKILLHILSPQSGEIFLDGHSLSYLSEKERAHIVAYVPQFSLPLFSITVFDFVSLGRAPYGSLLGFQSKKDIDLIHRALEETEVTPLKERHFESLSGGEKQRVLIAKALAQTPKLLILDEPTNHLDIKHQWDLVRLLKKLRQEWGLTIFAVFHDLGLASELSDEIILLKDKTVQGTPQTILTPEKIKSVFGISVAVDQNPFTGNMRITYQ